ncbi:MAG: hypothetical protein WC668_02175 [Patescibacteria group bacterium]
MFKENSQQFERPASPETENIISFEELYDFIEAQGEIHGSIKSYDAPMLRKIIERVRHGHRPIEFVTNTMGIRDTVQRLLPDDPVYLKYTKGSKAKKN